MLEPTLAAKLLVGIRRQRNWTQYELAAELGVSARTIRRWESGEREPNTRDMLLFRTLLAAEASLA